MNIGDVNNGKSTLTGRLLFDLNVFKNDEIEKTYQNNKKIDWTFFSDGLSLERQQQKTIAVGHKFFYFQNTKYHIMDAPGHSEYLVNLLSSMTLADQINLLISVEQTISKNFLTYLNAALYHTNICINVLINKMDLVYWSEKQFQDLRTQIIKFIPQNLMHRFIFIPTSAFTGENLTQKTTHMAWYQGPTVFEAWQRSENVNCTLKKIRPIQWAENKTVWYSGDPIKDPTVSSYPSRKKHQIINSKNLCLVLNESIVADDYLLVTDDDASLVVASSVVNCHALAFDSIINHSDCELRINDHRFLCSVDFINDNNLTLSFLKPFFFLKGQNASLYQNNKLKAFITFKASE